MEITNGNNGTVIESGWGFIARPLATRHNINITKDNILEFTSCLTAAPCPLRLMHEPQNNL